MQLPNGTSYEGYVAVDLEAHAYDAHYLFGNYYQYNAATAGSGQKTTADDLEAAESICPKGWTLPTAGSGSIGRDGSFAYMLQKYGLATSSNGGVVENGNYNLFKSPIYFGPFGGVYPKYGYARNIGVAASLRSKTAYLPDITNGNNNRAYLFSYSTLTDEDSPLRPSNYAYRYRGFMVRCITK